MKTKKTMVSFVHALVYKRGKSEFVDLPIEHDCPLPCPFCGNKTDFRVGHESSSSFHVRCNKCGARTRPVNVPDRWSRSKGQLETALIREAVKSWNRRTK